MMVSRNDNPLTLTKDTVLEKGDRVIAFGPYENMKALFGDVPD